MCEMRALVLACISRRQRVYHTPGEGSRRRVHRFNQGQSNCSLVAMMHTSNTNKQGARNYDRRKHTIQPELPGPERSVHHTILYRTRLRHFSQAPINHSPIHGRHFDLGLQDLMERDAHDVVRKHHKVGLFANLERADSRL